jgi:hypothetical protein
VETVKLKGTFDCLEYPDLTEFFRLQHAELLAVILQKITEELARFNHLSGIGRDLDFKSQGNLEFNRFRCTNTSNLVCISC